MAFPQVYATADGKSDVLEFLDVLPPKDLAKCRAELVVLAENLRPLQRPFAAYLRDGIWELRVRSKRVQYRFLFAQLPKREYVVLIAFQKKQSQVPPLLIDEACAQLVEWKERQKRS